MHGLAEERSCEIKSAFEVELRKAKAAEQGGQLEVAWSHLARAHILGQLSLPLHLRAHLCMLGVAWRDRNSAEILGQTARLFMTFLGHLSGRLPIGNSGRSNVSMFKPMDIPEDLRSLIQKQSGK